MITARFMGRLGNQMFEYAMARAQAKRLGVELVLDTTLYRQDHPFQLTQWSGVRERIVIGSKITIREQGMPYNEAIANRIKDGDVIQGYWQSEKYFLNIAAEIRQAFTPLRPFDIASTRIVHHMEQENSVAVHVRRGDYLKEPHKSHHGVLDTDYYQEARKFLLKYGSGYHFYIFSEDTEWCKENFESDDVTIIEPGFESRDLYMMAQCRHAIIANSTYSWWGAWLGDGKLNPLDRIVVAPKKWFDQAKENYSDVVPERWIKL